MPKDIGKTLKECRIASKMSVKEISDLLTSKGFKASESTIYSWENGNSQPTPGALLTMCTAYGVDNVLETFGYNGYNDDGSIRLAFHEIEYIEKYRSLDDPGRNHVDTVLQWETDRMEQLSTRDSQIVDLKSRSSSIKEFSSLVRDPDADYLVVDAAHARTDIEPTEEGSAHDDAIMDDDSEWEQ